MSVSYKDSKGRKLGRSFEDPNKIIMYDSNGSVLGRYDKKSNTTFDSHGRRIGTENQLTRFFDSDCEGQLVTEED